MRGTYTWDELGLDPEVRALIGGQTYVYTSDDGSTFEQATLPAASRGWGGQVLATDDGYRLFLGQADKGSATTQVLRSADGRQWVEAGSLPGSPQTAGLLGGRAAVALFGFDGGLEVLIDRADGSWTPLDLMSAVDGADAKSGVGEVAFGPLGIAAIVWTDDGPGGGTLVHSVDGTSVSAIALDDYLDEPGAVMGLSISADAILVRVDGPNDDDPTTPPTQRVLVGTPR